MDDFIDLSDWLEWIGNMFAWKLQAVDTAANAKMNAPPGSGN